MASWYFLRTSIFLAGVFAIAVCGHVRLGVSTHKPRRRQCLGRRCSQPLENCAHASRGIALGFSAVFSCSGKKCKRLLANSKFPNMSTYYVLQGVEPCSRTRGGVVNTLTTSFPLPVLPCCQISTMTRRSSSTASPPDTPTRPTRPRPRPGSLRSCSETWTPSST